MNASPDRRISALLKGLCCFLSGAGAYMAISWIAARFYVVSNPYDSQSALIGIGILTLVGLVGIGLRRIGLVALASSIALVAFAFWSIGFANADPLGQFLPAALCLAGMPLLNAIFLRLLLYVLTPDYGQAAELASASTGQVLASNAVLGGWLGPTGTRAPTPPAESPSSFSNRSSNDSDAIEATLGNSS